MTLLIAPLPVHIHAPSERCVIGDVADSPLLNVWDLCLRRRKS